MKSHINLILVFVAIAALIVAAFEYKHMRAAAKTNNDAAAAISKRNEAMQAQLESLKLAFPQSAADADGSDTDPNASALLTARKRAAKGQAMLKEGFNQAMEKYRADAQMLAERLKTDHEFALKHYAALRAQTDMVNAPFRRLHNLSREQSEALAEAEFQRMLRADDMQRAQDLNQPDVDVKAITKEANDEFASNARAALGDDLYEQFLVYQRQIPAWNFVNKYGSNASLADMSLSMEQASQLADAVANACPAFQEGKPVNMRTVDWNAVNAAAVDFLTPEQMDFFKNTNTEDTSWLSPKQFKEWLDAIPKQTQ